ncbi:preprotein translocase subunit YajC [Acetivibrio straminisolvens]|jgi:preprotein translocase subunit YajC|uniref:Preprotein translocase subunit YajC n=1 Tax=Acetivibrio straminisolvens JCM 21531 TaxID=1294263 RepID=W4V7J1_9FIRM|nr:preprotein translocase subunit YajC [Acetivibrio straminisolvens]GAE89187.1 preprotein translocase subunit YajC [Acetivibrio straminisolvens JCM 21531]
MPTEGGAGFQELFSALILPLAFVLIMYLMIILPQKKRDKKHAEMLQALKTGDNIITTGGIIGKVINIKDDEITIETSVEKTQIKLVRSAISRVVESNEE